MTFARLLLWLLVLPRWPDQSRLTTSVHMLRGPDDREARVLATAAMETEWPIGYAGMLEIVAPHESWWNPAAIGDGGHSCGLFQTPCRETPGFARDASAPKGWRFEAGPRVALEQARLAVRYLRWGNDSCPGHPLWAYASGRCAPSRTALWYEEMLHRALAVPVPVPPVPVPPEAGSP